MDLQDSLAGLSGGTARSVPQMGGTATSHGQVMQVLLLLARIIHAFGVGAPAWGWASMGSEFILFVVCFFFVLFSGGLPGPPFCRTRARGG